MLKDKLYLYRIRENSITNTNSNTPIPHYAKHIYDAFSDKEMAKQYHQKGSMFLMFLMFLDFFEKYPNKNIAIIRQHFLPFYATYCESLITCKQDPLNIIDRIHVIEPYLKKGFKYRYRLYMKNKVLYNLSQPIFDFVDRPRLIFACYDLIKGIERNIRKTLKLYKKHNKNTRD